MMVEVYVSYAVPDIRHAMAVSDLLTSAGFNVWLADVPDTTALNRADLVLAIVTAVSISQPHTLRDWTTARERGKLVLLHYEERSLPAVLQGAPRIQYGSTAWQEHLERNLREVAAQPLIPPPDKDVTTTQIVPDWAEIAPDIQMLPLPAGKYAHIILAAAASDRLLARRIAEDCRRSGFLTLLEPAAWQIAITGSVCMVVLLTPDAPASEQVTRYLHYAAEQNIPIYPVLVRGTYENATPALLEQREYINLERDYRRGLLLLANAIKRRL